MVVSTAEGTQRADLMRACAAAARDWLGPDVSDDEWVMATMVVFQIATGALSSSSISDAWH